MKNKDQLPKRSNLLNPLVVFMHKHKAKFLLMAFVKQYLICLSRESAPLRLENWASWPTKLKVMVVVYLNVSLDWLSIYWWNIYYYLFMNKNKLCKCIYKLCVILHIYVCERLGYKVQMRGMNSLSWILRLSLVKKSWN